MVLTMPIDRKLIVANNIKRAVSEKVAQIMFNEIGGSVVILAGVVLPDFSGFYVGLDLVGVVLPVF